MCSEYRHPNIFNFIILCVHSNLDNCIKHLSFVSQSTKAEIATPLRYVGLMWSLLFIGHSTSKLHMLRHVVTNNKHSKDTCYIKVGLCAQYKDTIGI